MTDLGELAGLRSRTAALPAASVAVVLGTRPEAVKLAGVVDLLGHAALVVHTGQHHDAALWGAVAAEVGLPPADVTFSVAGGSRGTQVGLATVALDGVLAQHRPLAVVVQGDTNAALAGALAANARDVPLVHVEAGLRSHDRRMPEEHNRVVIDHLADLLLAPTAVAAANLAVEGISPCRVLVTGNTVVEAVRRLLPPVEERAALAHRYGVEPARFVLVTLHRPENTDDPAVLAAVLGSLARLSLPVLLPLHPRTRDRAAAAGLDALLEALTVVEPLPPRAFLALQAEAALIVADSGGVQEEASVLGRPVLVVRRSTERPEVLGTVCELVSPGPVLEAAAALRLAAVQGWRDRLEALPSPYGDGTASARSVAALLDLLAAPAAHGLALGQARPA